MRYLGGKSKTWKEISEYLESIRKPDQTYLEPFVGGAWVLQGMSGSRIASDANKALITLYQSLQNGWLPPTKMDEVLYNQLKIAQNHTDPLTAFAGFGVSFGGKWFGGLAKSNESRNYAMNARNSLLKKLPMLQEVQFAHKSFLDYQPENMLIYCDPPYENTTKYNGVNDFDSSLFWETMRLWSKNNTVIISEYQAPEDFICVKQMDVKTDMHTKSGKEKRIEKLFQYKKIK